MVAQRFLVPLVGVRIPTGLPLCSFKLVPNKWYDDGINFQRDQKWVEFLAIQEYWFLEKQVLRGH